LIEGRNVIGIIPARAGSKRLPGKNTKALDNKPLVSWTMEAAINSKYLDQIVVTSDDLDIKNICEETNLTYLERASELATDEISSYAVVEDVLSKFDGFHIAVLLQPTSPFRTEFHIDEALEQFQAANATSLVSVCRVEHAIEWAGTIDDEGFFCPLNKAALGIQSQGLQPNFRLNGAIYINQISLFLREKVFVQEGCQAFVMDAKSSVDIDTEEDFKYAQFLLK
jgi:CMP-N,N'-diacetyllegionaminic acid synthase